MDASSRASVRCGKAALGAMVALGGVGFGIVGAASAGAAPTTITYTDAGETPFVVPAGVTSLTVTAVGAAGGVGTAVGGGTPGAGGAGSQVVATVPVRPGATYYVEVGVNGGAGGAGGGNGGGESDLRTCSVAVPATCVVPPASGTDPRLLVAGGGGGGGGTGLGFTGGAGGAAGIGATVATPICYVGTAGAPTPGVGGAGGACIATGSPVGGSAPGGAAGIGLGGGGGGYNGGAAGTRGGGANGGGGGGSSFSSVASAVFTAAASPASVTITYDQGADLSVTKTGSGSVRAGGVSTYTLTAADNGPDDATGVTLTDTLAPGETLVSSVPGATAATPGGPTCAPNTATPVVVTCNLGTVASGTSVPVYLTIAVPEDAHGTLIDTAHISGTQADPNLANNTATVGSTVTPAIHDGHDGHDGRPGRDGHDGRDGHEGHDGQDGRPGHDGRDGHAGRDGRDWHGQPCNFDNPDFPFCDA